MLHEMTLAGIWAWVIERLKGKPQLKIMCDQNQQIQGSHNTIQNVFVGSKASIGQEDEDVYRVLVDFNRPVRIAEIASILPRSERSIYESLQRLIADGRAKEGSGDCGDPRHLYWAIRKY